MQIKARWYTTLHPLDWQLNTKLWKEAEQQIKWDGFLQEKFYLAIKKDLLPPYATRES